MTQNLGKVGIVDKGVFDINKTYNRCDFVYFKGSTWLALKDNLIGIEPTESENWKYLAKGFEAEFLNMITAIDTSGLLGTVGATTDTQNLIDFIAKFVFEQEIEYITEGSILELCDKKKKSFRFLAYNDIGRGSSCSLIDTPSTHTDSTGNIWIGEFQWLIPIYEKGKTRPTNFHCILKMRNLLGEDYAKTGWLMGKEGEEIIGWDNWIQANGCSFAVNADVHGLGNGKYYVVRGTNLPNGLTDSYVEVFKNDYIEELLCRDGANIYIKKRFPYTEWGEWRCLSSDKTMPVYVGSTAPEDTNVLWVW